MGQRWQFVVGLIKLMELMGLAVKPARGVDARRKPESSTANRQLLTARKRRSLANVGERIGARAGKSGFALDRQPFAKASQHELKRRGTRGKPG